MGLDGLKITDLISWAVAIGGSFFVIRYQVKSLIERQNAIELKSSSHSEKIAVIENQIKNITENQKSMDVKLDLILQKVGDMSEKIAVLSSKN